MKSDAQHVQGKYVIEREGSQKSAKRNLKSPMLERWLEQQAFEEPLSLITGTSSRIVVEIEDSLLLNWKDKRHPAVSDKLIAEYVPAHYLHKLRSTCTYSTVLQRSYWTYELNGYPFYFSGHRFVRVIFHRGLY
jgi:hypothetical protein